jgi:hypothetical protein
MLSPQKLVVGIFHNRAQVEQAINELHQVGFDSRHIRFAKHGISTAGVLKKIKSSLGEQTIAIDRIYDELVNMGVPPEDARYYQSEFNAGRSIVVVLRSGVPLVATSIIIRNGGHIVKGHLVQVTDRQSTSLSTGIYIRLLKVLPRLKQSLLNRYLPANRSPSPQGRITQNAQLGPTNVNEPIAPSPDNSQDTSPQAYTTESTNAELNTNEPIASSPDNNQGTSSQEPPTESVNAELNTNEPIAPSPDNNQDTSPQAYTTEEDAQPETNSTNEPVAPSPDQEKDNNTQEAGKDLINA